MKCSISSSQRDNAFKKKKLPPQTTEVKLNTTHDLNPSERDTCIEKSTPTKDSTPIKETMRKCSSLQPVTINSHQFLFNTSIVYKNPAGELEITSPPEWRPRAAIYTPDGQLNRMSLSPQREPLDVLQVLLRTKYLELLLRQLKLLIQTLCREGRL